MATTSPEPPVQDEAAPDPLAGTGHLEERLARVTGAMNRIQKRGWNKAQSYAFASQADVLDAIRPALAAEGISFRSEMKAFQAEQEDRTTQGGSPWVMWRVDMQFTFSCWYESIEREFQDVFWSGWAEDFGDKGGPKALTGALKTFLIQQFLISTGDDPDEPPADTTSQARTSDNRANVAPDVRSARNAALDFNKELPKGVLSKIARKVAGNGVIMKIDDVAALQRIVKAAERYKANPEGGAAWLAGEDAPERQAASGEPDESDAAPEAAATEPSESANPQPVPGDPGVPDDVGAIPYEPVTPPLPAADSYDPPLNDDEMRQWHLGIDPRPEEGAL